MTKKEIYYQEKRFTNTTNGNPRKALLIYEKGQKSNSLYLKKVKTFAYESKSQVLDKMYKGKNVKVNEIYAPKIDSYRQLKEVEKNLN